jgi:hypothetical protein
VTLTYPSVSIEEFLRTTGHLKNSLLCSTDCTNTGGAAQSDQCEEKSNTACGSNLERHRYDLHKPLSHADERQKDKDEPLDEHGCQSQIVRDDAVAMFTYNLGCEVGVQSHSWPECDGHIGEEAEEEGGEACDCCGGCNQRAGKVWFSVSQLSRSTSTLYTLLAERIFIKRRSVCQHTEPVFAAVTDAIATGLSQDACLRW